MFRPVTNQIELRPGDKVFVKGDFGVRHYGVYVGCDWQGKEMVVQNLKGRSVEETSLGAFSAGRPIFIEQRARNWLHAEEIVQRARSLVGTNYDLISFNCEQAANYAVNGRPFSLQLQEAVGLLLLVGVVLFAFGSG